MNDQLDSRKYMPVAAVSIETQCAVLDDGRICKLSAMYDGDGEETNDITVAVTAVAPHPDGPWMVLHLKDFEGVTIH